MQLEQEMKWFLKVIIINYDIEHIYSILYLIYLILILNKGENADGTSISGIPEDVHLFEVFWEQITELIKVIFEIFVYDNHNNN